MTNARPYPRRRSFAPLLIVAALASGPAAAAQSAGNAAEFRQTCADAVAVAERRHAIPDKLLTAISHAESGHWDTGEQATIAWPWTVTAEGAGHYLPSRAAAIAKVEALRARGVTSIDVGCMQVNLRYHPDAFADLAAAFDPATNAAYAGSFLASLQQETGSWTAAAARYHSATREFAVPYRARVMRLWRAAKAQGKAQGTADTRFAASAPSAVPAAAPATAPAQAAATPPSADAEAQRRAAAAHRRAVVAAYLARRAARQAETAPQRVAAAD